MTIDVSNSPVIPAGVPAENVCAAVSVLENITTPPRSTVAVLGVKHPSGVSSHPGTPEPATGTTNTSE